MIGAHQQDNAATVLNLLQQISDFDIPQTAIQAGLKNINWPARLQRVEADFLPENAELWIDGGHNESAANILARQAESWAQQDGKKLHIILGMMKNKTPQGFIQPLLPYIESLSCVNVPGETMMCAPDELKQTLKELDIKNLSFTDQPVLDVIKDIAQPNSRYLITGSLYLAGHILGQL